MAKKNEISQDMIDNIKNYGSEIRTLKDFVEAVRQNPGYHLGSKGNKGFMNMIREIIQNSLDELDKEKSPCTDIWFSMDERTNGITCIDNGRGIPHDNILRIFTNPNTSSNYDKKPGEYSSGLHGVGSKVTNAMSHRFIIESYILGKARRVEFTEGYPWDKGELEIPNKDNKQGTMVYFEPSIDALGDINVSWQDVYDLIKRIIPLSKIGAIVHFSATDKTGKVYSEDIINQDGVITYIIRTINTPLVAPIVIGDDTGIMKTDIAFTWDTGNTAGENIMAFANKCPTTLGTHIDGFIKGVTSFFVNYMNKIYLANNKKNKVTVIANDVRNGLNAVVTVSHLHPIFDGQSKDKLANDEIEPFVKNVVYNSLDNWSKNNPKDLNKVCKFIKEMADIRLSTDKQRIKLSNNYAKSKLTGLPSKFVAPTRECEEFFITEGDSAAGLMKNNRINFIQGYYPIRGKIPNAFTTTRVKFLANAEVSGLIQIIGGGYGKDFDITKVKWKKIIICTDADADGNHIRALLLRFFILYMPGLLESGRVYVAVPPLYGIKLGKDKYKYLTDRYDYVNYIQKDFLKANEVKYASTKNVIPNKELSKILYTNIDYKYTVDGIANRYAVNPILLESILVLLQNKVSFTKFKSSIMKQFRFISKIEKVQDTIVVDGLVNGLYQTVFVNDRLINDCREIVSIMNNNSEYVYILNDKICSIYELMTIFDKSAPSSIQRYKGLGEMDGKRLFDSTLDPDKRTLIQYTVEDVKDEIEKIRYYESNKDKLLTTTKLSRFEVVE